MYRRTTKSFSLSYINNTTSNITRSFNLVSTRQWHYKPRTREYAFLYDVLGYKQHYEALGYGDQYDTEFISTITDECSKLCTNTLFPLYMSGDREGCTLKPDGTVNTPKGFKEAYNDVISGGWCSMAGPEKYGGQGLPYSVELISKELMATANWGFFMYSGLSSGAAATIMTHGTEEMKNLYLRKLLEGSWTGTMCLTEPHCGTDLAQVKTRAIPVEGKDNEYTITGTKIFISAGEHDLAENILHIVLAKLPGSPSGTKGISLFIVPKFIPKNEDGSELESKRNLTCIGLEEKMGIHGNSTCQIQFEDSIGYLIGEPNEGLRQMFTFMNTARIGTAMQGVTHSELAFQNALAYARERTSMRSLSGKKEPNQVADRIIHHPGVRQQILFAKAISEGGRAMLFDLAKYCDGIWVATQEGNKEKLKEIDAALGFLTPIAKGVLTELGTEAAIGAQQCFGGHGYIKGNGMELIVRDSRIGTIYEGTTGIQALDYIGRKVLMNKMKEFSKFGKIMTNFVWNHVFSTGTIGSCARSFYKELQLFKLAPYRLIPLAAQNKEAVGSAAHDFLFYSGYIMLGYYWLRMAAHAQAQLKTSNLTDTDKLYYQDKIDVCDFYFHRVFPRVTSHLRIMTTSPNYVLNPREESLDM